jgi:hypothetical protein
VCQIGTGVDDLPIGKTGETPLRYLLWSGRRATAERCAGIVGAARQARSIHSRLAFFNSDEAMVEFTRRRPQTLLEDRNIFEMQMRRTFGEITLGLTAEQFARLNR